MSNVTKDSTLMCVRITEPAYAQVGCSLDQVQERVRRKATRMFADKLFEEGQVVVQQVDPFGKAFGSPDITYEVGLTLVPVAEHKKQVKLLQNELARLKHQATVLETQLAMANGIIKDIKQVLA